MSDEKHERLLESLNTVYAYVPLAHYDDVTKLAEREVEDLLAERDSLLARLAATEAERDDLIESEDSQLRAIQTCIRSWQRAGARENVVPLVLADICSICAAGLIAERDDLRDKLTAAECDNDEWNALVRETQAARAAAEARVEALTVAAERFRAAIDAPSHDGWLTELNAAEVALDAALCAPPVPETPKCNGNCIGTGSIETLVEDLTCPIHGIEAQEQAEKLFPDRVAWLASLNAPGGPVPEREGAR